MKCEGMPTLRHEEKRVEERNSVRGREGERETERERERAHVQRGERESTHALLLLLLYVFLPLGLPYANWASQKCCFFYLKSSLWSSDLPLTFLCSIFVGFSLPCLLATAILDSVFYSNYLTTSKISRIMGDFHSFIACYSCYCFLIMLV